MSGDNLLTPTCLVVVIPNHSVRDLHLVIILPNKHAPMIMRIGKTRRRVGVLVVAREEAVHDANGPRRRASAHGAVSNPDLSFWRIEVGRWICWDPGGTVWWLLR